MKPDEVTRAYLEEMRMTQEQFAQALNESLVNTGITRVSVSNWLRGRSQPETDFLLSCLVAYSDWRKAWAADMLAAKLPHVFEVERGRVVVLA